jgi:hypothetical protein
MKICSHQGGHGTQIKHLSLQSTVLTTAYVMHSEYSNIYPTRCNVTQFILSGNCSTYFGKHVQQFPDKIKCVTLRLGGYILEYSYDARTHEC